VTRERWIGLLVAGMTIIATLIILWLVDDAGAQYRLASYCIKDTDRELVRNQAFAGVDKGFTDHVGHLFEIWVRDPHEQPKRAKVGIQSGISADLRAREDIQKWEPPRCE
jgi:hypothetical protein